MYKRIFGIAVVAIASVGVAQNLFAPGQPLPVEKGHEPVPLWQGAAPGAKGTAEMDIPTLAAYIPASNPTHTAVVIAPGGGYSKLAYRYEGIDMAKWLNEHGVAAFVLNYRIGPTYQHPVELGDAQRAIRTARSLAEKYGYSVDHVGMWGSSAGGHLTATAGTHFDAGNPNASDPIERLSSRPDFLILDYPVIRMDAPYKHNGSTRMLLGENPDPALVQNLSDDTQVTPQTPPTFIWSTTDDKVVPVMNTVLFYQALVKNGVQAELHIFRHGKHGLGLAQNDPDISVWPQLLLHWMAANGWATLK